MLSEAQVPMNGWTPVWLLVSCLLAGLLSAVVVRGMIRLAVMDVPGGRSAHDRPVPRGGGAGTVVVVLLGVPVMVPLLSGGQDPVRTVVLLEVALALLAAVSWLDDLRQLGYRAKLSAQLAASALAVAAALADLPVLPPSWLLWPGLAVAFCWLMVVTNAVNFIDGINGLAAGSIAVCGLFVAVLGWRMDAPVAVAAGLMLASGLAGFLPFNYPRARIFLGDIGSQVCGLLAGTLSLPPLAVPGWRLAALGVPLVLAGILWDVLFTLCRRLLGGERLTQAHRGHLYQVATRVGIPAVRVTAIHWTFATWGGMLALTLLPRHPVLAVVLALLPQPGWTGIVRRRALRARLDRWS